MQQPENHLRQDQVIMLQDLPEGSRIMLRDNVTAEVTGNPKDGSWIFVRYISHPADPSLIGTEDLVFASDILSMA